MLQALLVNLRLSTNSNSGHVVEWPKGSFHVPSAGTMSEDGCDRAAAAEKSQNAIAERYQLLSR